jgi:hypothetical protein
MLEGNLTMKISPKTLGCKTEKTLKTGVSLFCSENILNFLSVFSQAKAAPTSNVILKSGGGRKCAGTIMLCLDPTLRGKAPLPQPLGICY